MDIKTLPPVGIQMPGQLISAEDYGYGTLQMVHGAVMPEISIDEFKSRQAALKQFVDECLTEDVDYGKFPGVDKKSLFQPGAEKLNKFFGLTPRSKLIAKEIDWTGNGAGAGDPFFAFWFRTDVYNKYGVIVGVGYGHANSHESKWGYRWVSEEELGGVIPNGAKIKEGSIVEFEFAIYKAETSGKYGKPKEYWDLFKTAISNGTAIRFKKKTRDGEEMPAIRIRSMMVRVANEEVCSNVHTIEMMAKKRSEVAGTRQATGTSEWFTQDIEDLQHLQGIEPYSPPRSNGITPNIELPPEPAPVPPAPSAKTAQADSRPPAVPSGDSGAYPAVPQPQKLPKAASHQPALASAPPGAPAPSNAADRAPAAGPAPDAAGNEISDDDIAGLKELCAQNKIKQKVVGNYSSQMFGAEPRKIKPEQFKELINYVKNGLMTPDQYNGFCKLCRVKFPDISVVENKVYEMFGKSIKHMDVSEVMSINDWMENE